MAGAEPRALPDGVVSGVAALGALEAIIDRAATRLFSNYIDRKALPFAAGMAVEQAFDAVARASTVADDVDMSLVLAGNGSGAGSAEAASEAAAAASSDPISFLGMWECEAEPVPPPIDAAARGAVATRAPKPPVPEPEPQPSPPGRQRRASATRGAAAGRSSREVEAAASRAASSGAAAGQRPTSPTDADTLLLQKELAIPQRPSSVADGSKRPAPRDGPEHQLRRSVLAKERAARERSDARRRAEAAERSAEADMIKRATGAGKGQRFTLHDDGSLLPIAGTRRGGRGQRPGTSGSEVRPGVRLRDEGSLEVDEQTQALLQSSIAGTAPTFTAGPSAQPAFGGRAVRKQRLADTLSRSRDAATAGGAAPRLGSSPPPPAGSLDEGSFFREGLLDHPSIVDALGSDDIAPGAVLREQGRADVAGGPHPKEAGAGRARRPGRSRGAGPVSLAARPLVGPATSPASPSTSALPAVASPAPAESPDGGKTRSGRLTPVSVHAGPSDGGFRPGPAPASEPAARAPAPSPTQDGLARPSVREQRGQGGFVVPPSAAGGGSGSPGSRTRDRQSPHGRGRRAAADPLSASPAARHPRERLPKQAKPRPEDHAAPPLWPGTSRFDPRGVAGPLGSAGVVEVDGADAGLGASGDGLDRSGLARSIGAREWGEAAARRTGGSLIVGGGEGGGRRP